MHFNYEAAPLVLALVLGPLMEQALRQSLIMSNGSLSIFFGRPISLVIVLVVVILLVLPLLPWVKAKREVVGEIPEDE